MICVEDSLLVTKNTYVPYIKASKDVIKTTFQSFKIVMASYMVKNSSTPWPILSKASNMMAKVMLRGREKVGKGLKV